MCLYGNSEALAGRSTTFTGNQIHTGGLRVAHGESTSLSASAKDETVGEEAMVGRRDSSMEGVEEEWEGRIKSSFCRERESILSSAMARLDLEGGVPLVGVSGEGGSAAAEKEEAGFLDEQVLRVSGALREVEEALARLRGGEREEGEGSDMA